MIFVNLFIRFKVTFVLLIFYHRMEGFKAIGLSYHNAPIQIREKVALSESESRDLSLKLQDVLGIDEILVISTCNRTEIYYFSSENSNEDIIKVLASIKAISSSELSKYFISYSQDEAIQHLFEVSLGLDSQVLGDIQISNQVKRAYQLSADLKLAGPFTHRIMHTIFFAHKRVVQETRLQDGTASVASVAVEAIKEFSKVIINPKLVLVGLGEIGQNVLENLGELELDVCLVNRTKSKAEKLASLHNLKVEDYTKLDEVVADSDIIVSAVSAKSPIITKRQLSDNSNRKLLVDLSVPRSIDTNVEEIAGVMLYNVDQLSEKTEKARAIRQKAIPQVEEIIKESIDGFNKWKAEMEVSPTIHRLKSALDKIRNEELASHKLDENERELVELVTKNMMQRIIKLPVLQLKAACKRGEADTLVDVLNDLFNLEQEKVSNK